MKSRYLFNATTGSVLVTPYDYVLEARPGSLRLIQPSGATHAIHLVVIIAVVFGYLGLFALVANSSIYQAARPWENPPLLWATLGLFFLGFFASLYATERWGQRLAVRGATRLSARADAVTLRGLQTGRLIQKVLLQTADNRLLPMDIEAAENRFRKALDIARVPLPPVPVSDEEYALMESSRRATLDTAPGPVGPGRVNVPGLAFVMLFVGFFDTLSLWVLASGELVLGILGLAIFGPMTIYMAYAVARTRRFHCGVCDHLTTFRRRGETWTCGRCGGSWPRSPGAPQVGG